MNDSLKEEILKYIEKSHFFSTIPTKEINAFLPFVDKISLLAGKILYLQGDESAHVYFLIKGKLVALLTKPSGKMKVIGKINSFEPVGELGALSSEPRGFTIKASEDSELLRLSSKVFKELCYKYPTILNKISNIIIDRSLRRLNYLANDKSDVSITLLYSSVQNNSSEKLRIKFKRGLQELGVNLLLSKELSAGRISNIQTESRHIYIFMQKWDAKLFNSIKEKITRFYFIIGEEEEPYCHETEGILAQLRKMINLRLELILLHQEDVEQITNTRRWLINGDFNLHHHMRVNNEDDFKRIIRFMLGKAHVLVLGGGGSKAVIHLGVIKALLENEIPIDAIAGTSAGAGIAACYALALNYPRTLILADKLIEASVQSLSIRNLTWPIVSLFSSNPISKVLKNIMGTERIEDLLIPYFAVSSDITDNRLVIHRNGLIWEAIRSSAAVPGIFSPLVRDGKLSFDGGLLNNLPVDVMRDIIGNGHTIVASSPSRKSRHAQKYQFPPVLTLWQTMLSKLRIAHRDYIFPSYFETFFECLLVGSYAYEDRNCLEADILIRPDLTGFKTFSCDKKHKDMLIEIGYKEAIASLRKKFNIGQ